MFDVGTDAYYRHVCENLGVALIATDREFNIVTWNGAAARTFGAAAEQMIGTPVVRIIPQERRRLSERMLRRALTTGETIQLEFHHRDPKGKHRELAATIAPILSDDAERVGLSVCIRDITRRIEMQNELHENRKMAALGEMAGAIAHHFNNILGGVITSVDFASESDDPELKARTLWQIVPALQRATTLVKGMLAFAGVDYNVEDLSDFTEMISHVADEVERAVAGRKIDFTLILPTLPVLPFPRTPVLTILRNITQNAIEAMPNGGSLSIEVGSEEDAVNVRVTDTGCGLDEAAKSRIFEPFWSTKGVLAAGAGTATGLGLATAHGLVQMLGGSISVTSEPAQGSCFRVTLPTTQSA